MNDAWIPDSGDTARGATRASSRLAASGAFYTLVPIRPRSRGERRSLRTFAVVSLRPPLPFNTRPRRLSTPTDTFQLHPDFRLYRTALSIIVEPEPVQRRVRGHAAETKTAAARREPYSSSPGVPGGWIASAAVAVARGGGRVVVVAGRGEFRRSAPRYSPEDHDDARRRLRLDDAAAAAAAAAAKRSSNISSDDDGDGEMKSLLRDGVRDDANGGGRVGSSLGRRRRRRRGRRTTRGRSARLADGAQRRGQQSRQRDDVHARGGIGRGAH